VWQGGAGEQVQVQHAAVKAQPEQARQIRAHTQLHLLMLANVINHWFSPA
jgi:hypothetical protein